VTTHEPDDLPPLDALRDAPAPPVSAVRRRVRERRTLRLGVLAGAPAVVVALVALRFAATPGTRDRGVGGAVPRARLLAVVEGVGPARPFAGGDVRSDERVVFSVRADRPALAVLREVTEAGDVVVWPTTGTWRVEGEVFVGGATPLAYRPEVVGGSARYELLACPDEAALATGEDCARDSLTVRWTP
jgi:hypothetical protein